MMRFPKAVFATALATWFAMAPVALAADRPSLIRDAEIESIIRGYASPIFTAAGIDPASIDIYIVNDDAINAFVAGGLNLFLYAGLLMRMDKPNQVIGVIAHETGHMAGGHLIRTREALRAATAEAILAYILGIGAGVAAGNAGAGAAIVSGGQAIAQANLLQFTRTQENSADYAGLRFLETTHQSARGLLDVLHMLQKNEVLTGAGGNPYLRTHPLTKERLDYIGNYVAQSPYSDAVDTPETIESYHRMRAKLIGFLHPLPDTLSAYPETDTSFAGRYARAIAYFRVGQLQKALPLVDGLIGEEPQNPYLQELKGQMLFENGRTADSIPPYREAVRLRPDSSLLHLGLAESMIELGDPALNKQAISELETAVGIEPKLNQAWRLLSIAYDRDGQAPMTALALAELSLGRGDNKEAERHAERALDMLPQGSPAWLRAEDIVMQATQGDD
jgi:predicted Zn-dependent protease